MNATCTHTHRHLLAKQDMSPEELRIFREFARRWELETAPLVDDIQAAIEGNRLSLGDGRDLEAQLRSVVSNYQADIDTALVEVGEDGIRAGRELASRRFALDISFETIPEHAIEELEEWAVTASQSVSDEMAQNMRNYLRGAYEEGLSIDDIAEEFGSEFVEDRLHGTHEEQIARDVVQGTSNQGNHTAFEEADVFAEQWNTALDGRQRESHGAADGQIVGLENTFIVGGHELRYPHDPLGPVEEVTNCRCNLLPLWRDDLTRAQRATIESGGRIGG